MSSSTETASSESFAEASPLDLRNKIQETFGRHPIPWFDWVFDALHAPAQAAVLDLGCGSGAFWQHNRKRIPAGWDIFLSDRSAEMVHESCARLTPPRARFFRADCQAIPFEPQHFDAVLAVGLLDLVPDIHAALRQIRRVLRPGGLLLATAGGKNHLREMEELLRPFVPAATAHRLGGNDEHFGMENGERLLSAWFSDVTRREYHDQLVFTDAQPVAEYIRSERDLVQNVPGQDLLSKIQQTIRKNGALRVRVHKGLFAAR